MSNSADVGRYYDANHHSFLRFGVGRRAGVIHRAVWADGVQSRLEALHYAHDLVASQLDELGGIETARVLDLGCGAGASLRYLSKHGLGSGVGVSNSAAQVETAISMDRQSAGRGQLEFLMGDLVDSTFLDTLPFANDEFDLVFAIESFAHIRDAGRFFDTAVRFLRPGGRVVLIDDLLQDPPSRRQRQARPSSRFGGKGIEPEKERRLAEFERGWSLAPLRSPRVVRTLARRAGLEAVHEIDLTAFLESGTLRDRLVAVTVGTLRPLAKAWPFLFVGSARWSNLVGGHALQRLLSEGIVEYRCMVFRKS